MQIWQLHQRLAVRTSDLLSREIGGNLERTRTHRTVQLNRWRGWRRLGRSAGHGDQTAAVRAIDIEPGQGIVDLEQSSTQRAMELNSAHGAVSL
jgi:hypothetical protein